MTKSVTFIFQSFPRSIVLSANGRQLVQWPINEIEKLRTNNVSFEGKELKQGSVLEVSGITASQVTRFIQMTNSILLVTQYFS